MNRKHLCSTLVVFFLGVHPGFSQVPPLVHFQGRVAVDGVNFDGLATFKVAIIDPDRPASYWSNDGTSVNGSEPAAGVKIPVTNGLYSILLGDATLPGMDVLPVSVFTRDNLHVRVWFDDGANGSQQLAPDQRIAAVGYALMAATVPGGSIGSAELANGAVTSNKIANASVTSLKMAPNSIGPNELSPGAVGSADIAANAVGTSELNLAQVDARYVQVAGDTMSNTSTGTILTVDNTSTTGTDTQAILARMDSSSTFNYAIQGVANASASGVDSAGVRGQNNATNASGWGVYGRHAGSGGGVIGWSDGDTGSGRGVFGRSDGDTGRGVFGWANNNAGNTFGVYGVSDSTTGTGVYGHANGNTGLNYAVRGIADSAEGYGGYFTNAAATGGVGVFASGSDNGAPDIVLGGNDDGRIFSNPAFSSSDIWLHSNDGIVLQLDNDNANEDSDVEIKRGDTSLIMNIDDSGWTQWWRPDGTQLLELHSNGAVEFFGPTGTEYAQLQEDTAEGGGELLLRFPDGSNAVVIEAAEVLDDGAQIALYNSAGVQTLTLDAENGSGAPSRVITGTVQITGGSDLSEQFEVSGNECIEEPEPGMIVCIDPEKPGQLKPSTKAYDRTVAGIISGAGGIRTGMLMGQDDSVANGAHPVALTGRVYCMMDASHGAIEPGDLITTSDTPGHGMKVADHDLARGAIIGKAMTRLEEGSGLVMVLVSLQ